MKNVLNQRSGIIERTIYISPDGEQYRFQNNYTKFILKQEGWGTPPTGASEVISPTQHGATILAERYQKRIVKLTHLALADTREEYDTNKESLLDILRINRTNVNNPSPGILRKYFPNGDVRQLDVFVSKGPVFKDRVNRWSLFSVEEEITFAAFNPIVYDPTIQSISQVGFGTTVQSELQFPISFTATTPVFGITASTVATWSPTISYEGTWEEYPTIIITGPVTNPTIKNTSTNVLIELNTTIGSGEVVTIALSYDEKSVINNSGTSLLGTVTDDAQLALFSIQPHPIVTNGDNLFEITAQASDASTTFEIQYKHRYTGK